MALKLACSVKLLINAKDLLVVVFFFFVSDVKLKQQYMQEEE